MPRRRRPRPAWIARCPLCLQDIYASRERAAPGARTIINIDVWPPASIHICPEENP